MVPSRSVQVERPRRHATARRNVARRRAEEHQVECGRAAQHGDRLRQRAVERQIVLEHRARDGVLAGSQRLPRPQVRRPATDLRARHVAVVEGDSGKVTLAPVVDAGTRRLPEIDADPLVGKAEVDELRVHRSASRIAVVQVDQKQHGARRPSLLHTARSPRIVVTIGDSLCHTAFSRVLRRACRRSPASSDRWGARCRALSAPRTGHRIPARRASRRRHPRCPARVAYP